MTHSNFSIVLLLTFISTASSLLFFACKKDSLNLSVELLENKAPSEQFAIVSNHIEANGFVSPEVFSILEYEVSRAIYKKVTNDNRQALWMIKISHLQTRYANEKSKLFFLEKLSKFIVSNISNASSTISSNRLESIYNLEREAKEHFGWLYKDHFGHPQLKANYLGNSEPISKNPNQFNTLSEPKIPNVASCKCNVVSDYCSGSLKCFAPRVQCDSNSDMFCGFLLLQPCDGVCL